MTDQERHAFFDRLSAAIEEGEREDFERWRRRACGGRANATGETDVALRQASEMTVWLATLLSNTEIEDMELALTAALHAFRAHRCLHRIAERAHGAP